MDAQPHIHSAPGILSRPVPSGISARRGEKDTVDDHATNIVIYGETGIGKSHIINLIAGQELAHTSNEVVGCTFQHQRHNVELDGMSCALWEITGLDDGIKGTPPADQAESNLILLLQELANAGGIHLLVYCICAGRFRNTHQRNYDLFYVTVCRKKVPVALVVTGLEHQQGEMETWWAENEDVLRQYGMLFDEHACVTTLVVGNHLIQQRRSDSRRLLRKLVLRYSILPPWRIDPSFISLVLPIFRPVLRRMMVADGADGIEQSTTIRRVITCDMVSSSNASIPIPIKLSSDIPLWGTRTECIQIKGRSFEFVHVDKSVLQMHTLQEQHAGLMDVVSGAGVLVFHTSPLGNIVIPAEEVDMMEVFYEIAGGQMCPIIVVLQGCNDEERAIRECRDVLVSRHANVQAYFTSFLSMEVIERLCVEHVQVKTPTAYKARWGINLKQPLVTAMNTVISMCYVTFGWRRG